MIEIEGKVVLVSDEDLKFVIDHKGNGVAPKDRNLAIEMMKERIFGGNNELLGYFYGNENIPQAQRTAVFNQYYTKFPVHEMKWDELARLLLSPDKREYISRLARGNDASRITPEIIAAQIKFAIAAIPKAGTFLTSNYEAPLKNRRGDVVGKAWLSDMKEAAQRIPRIPNITDAQLSKLKEEHKLVVTGTDGKQYFLKQSYDEVYAYKNESNLPKEAEEAFLQRFIKESLRERGIYNLLEFASKHLDYELWHREAAWKAVLAAVSHENMHALYQVFDKKHRQEDDWTCDYPQEWAQPAKEKLRELQESYLKELGTVANADHFHALSSIYGIAQTPEIKRQAYELMKTAYVAMIDEKIAKGENIDYECRTEGDIKVNYPRLKAWASGCFT